MSELVPIELDEIVFRRSKKPSIEQRENYLELLSEGMPHVMAARKVGSTGTAFKSARKNDSHFNALCELAESTQHESREEQVRASLWEILYDKNHPKHWEAVRFAAEVYLGETEYKRIKQVHKRVDMESAIAATLHISVETLQQLPDEELNGLILQMERINAEPKLRAVE